MTRWWRRRGGVDDVMADDVMADDANRDGQVPARERTLDERSG
jgi:hypothetical protein